jgi:hypothetical protein
MVEEKPRARVDRPRTVFLAIVGACAVGVAVILARLPEDLRALAVLWAMIGLPFMFFVLRLWRGYVQMTLADLEHRPQQPPPPAPQGVGERDQGLRVVEASESKQGRRLL